jgi:predicted negative regulator of RcsB-dependent stress response
MFSYLFKIIGFVILIFLIHHGWNYFVHTKPAPKINRQIEKYKAIVEEIQQKQQNQNPAFLSTDDKTTLQQDLADFLKETEKLNIVNQQVI